MIRPERFEVMDDGTLIMRRSRLGISPGYEHTCEAGSYDLVAWAIQEAADRGETVTIRSASAATGIPETQVATAMAFLVDRGVLRRRRDRRSSVAGRSPYLDALTEIHALRDLGPSAEAFSYPEIRL